MLNRFPQTPPNWINFGLDLKTRRLSPHSADYFFVNTVHANSGSDATPTRFLGWLENSLPDDIERDKLRLVLGYSLTASCGFQKFFVLTGSPAKSVFVKVFASIVGEPC